MTAHVFIVSTTTFSDHLRHSFAGIGSRSDSYDLLTDDDLGKRARTLSAMACDVARIAPGDTIFFYLQSSDDGPGLFFGEWIATDRAYGVLDATRLGPTALSKALPLRVSLSPSRVFPVGVRESSVVDRLIHPETGDLLRPFELQWSLLYRKLLGNRGCLALRDCESDLLRAHLRVANEGEVHLPSSGILNFDDKKRRIFRVDPEETQSDDDDTDERLEIDLKSKYLKARSVGRSAEVFLQWILLDALVRRDPGVGVLTNDSVVRWIGNEVGSGAGARKIDIMLEVHDDDIGSRRLLIVELKDGAPSKKHRSQLLRYVQWAIDHYGYEEAVASIEPILITTKNGRFGGGGDLAEAQSYRRGAVDFSSKIRPMRHLLAEIDPKGHTLTTAEILNPLGMKPKTNPNLAPDNP